MLYTWVNARLQPWQPKADDEHAEGKVEKYPVWSLSRFQSVCGKSEQAKTHPGYSVAEPGQADRLSVQVSHGQVRGWAVQRWESLSHQTDQRA